MLKGNESLLESILFAFGLEKGSNAFYAKAAEKVDDPKCREFFNAMADVELGHMANLRLMYCSMEDDMCPVSLEEFTSTIPGPYVEGGKLLENALRELDVAFIDEMDAMKVAVRHEGEAYGFYVKAAKRMEDPMVKVLFENLAGEEQRHLNEVSKRMKAMGGE
ncbi:MAG: ferritin family protein [Nitrospirae bacterium]|nr:ferritin family protein [Nitrospirota bacterium]MBI5694278.1 ferritin family protein [Nitrospirota bacterium]